MWQLDRHYQRAALNARIAAGLAQSPVALETVGDLQSLDYRPVTARGEFTRRTKCCCETVRSMG